MEYRFSDRVSSLKPSAIREIFKYAADPSVVSLSAGNPSPDAFPSKEIAEISAKVFAEDPISVLQYSVSEGYTPLRKHLTEYMKKEHNTGSDNDDNRRTADYGFVLKGSCKRGRCCNLRGTVIHRLSQHIQKLQRKACRCSR